MEPTDQPLFRFRKHAWKQFKKNKPALISLYVLVVLAFIALMAPIIANERPLYMKYHGVALFPAFSLQNSYELKSSDGTMERIQPDITDWKQLAAEKVIWAPVPYSPGKSDYLNADYKRPAGEQRFMGTDGNVTEMPPRFRHWLGTGNRGEDLLAGLIHGTRISLTIGFISMGIAAFIGILIGSFAGFFGDDRLVTTRGRFWVTILGLFFAWFYGFQLRVESLKEGLSGSGHGFLPELIISGLIFVGVSLFFSQIGRAVGMLPWLKKKMRIPSDMLLSRLIEIVVSLPLFILILAIAAISRPSLINLMIIIGFTNWTGIARLTRAEMLRIRHLEFIQSAEALGYSNFRIIFRHALPNAIAPALVSISFGIANAILIESALSFIGLGVPPDITTWGSLLNAGRSNFNAWWLVVFPGLFIFITVTVYNLIGEGLRDALDPKMKR
jgi:peptide/nickel transport system permease protein